LREGIFFPHRLKGVDGVERRQIAKDKGEDAWWNVMVESFDHSGEPSELFHEL
jgi:hypothetical protein